MARLRSSTWPIVWVVVLLLSVVTSGPGTEALAQAHPGHGSAPAAGSGDCPWGDVVPLGALPGQPSPAWCAPLASGVSTVVDGANAWLDDFDHGLSNADMGTGYRVFENQSGSTYRTQHFRHADHWMVDISGQAPDGPPPWNVGGAMMRPDRSFRFQDGRLVVEATVAAGVDGYQGNAWPELVVTTAPAPTYARPTSGDIYAYDQFANHDTIGARLGYNGDIIVALFDNTERGPGQGGRVYEAQNFQHADAAVHFGGDRFAPDRAAAYHICQGTDPDTHCRDTFRWEIEKDRWAFFVNGVRYMEFSGWPPEKQLPDRFVDADVYVYFAQRIFKPDAPVVRFHWDRLAVNPSDSGAAAASANPPSAPASHAAHGAPQANTAGPVAAGPAPEPDPAPPASADPSAPLTLTFDDRPGQGLPLNGQYPVGVVDWGSDGTWYLSGPFGTFSTKSVSFNGSGRTSAAFTVPTPRRLVKLDAFNGGTVPSTVHLSCAGSPDKELRLAAGGLATIETGWTDTCTSITIASSNGWDTNFDNLVFDGN